VHFVGFYYIGTSQCTVQKRTIIYIIRVLERQMLRKNWTCRYHEKL